MDKKNISKIIDYVKETDLVEFSLTKEDSKIFFRRNPAGLKNACAETDQPVEEQISEELPEKKKHSIKSLMVGTFYHSSANDRPPFVVEGSKVVPGQKVGVIEAMKIMKDVICTEEGRITKICASNASHVEYGQDLFLVEQD